MRRKLLCAVIWCGLVGCSKIKVENPTDKFAPGKRVTRLEHKQLGEISGGAASVSNPGLMWVHNDSGNPAEIFLIDKDLNILLTCDLTVDNRDWEDIAVGPGPVDGKSYVYVGEIGDNNSRYLHKIIYRFEEPVWDKTKKKISISSFDTITFLLEDKKKDTETLLVDPESKDLYIVSKREEPVTLYQLTYPYRTDTVVTAKKLGSLPLTQIVGGDISPDGKQVLLKNYEHVYYWETKKHIPIHDLLKQKPFEVPYELEPQGEAIMWARDGTGFYTISEKNKGKDSYLYFYELKQAKP